MILFISILFLIIVTIILLLKFKPTTSSNDDNDIIKNNIKCDDYSMLVDGKCKFINQYKNVYTLSPGEIIPNTADKASDNNSNTYWETNYTQWPQPNDINRITTIRLRRDIQGPTEEVRLKNVQKFKIKFQSGPVYNSYPFTKLKVFDGEQEDNSKIIIDEDIERKDQVIEKIYDFNPSKMLDKVLVTLYPGVSKIYDVALIDLCNGYRFENTCVDKCPREAPRIKNNTCIPCLPNQNTVANAYGFYCECPYDTPRYEDETCKECLPETQVNKDGKCVNLKKYNIITYSYPPGVNNNFDLNTIDNNSDTYWETNTQDANTILDIKLDPYSNTAIKNIQQLVVKFEPKSTSIPTIIDMYEANYGLNGLPFFRRQITSDKNIIEERITFASERMNKVRIIFSPGVKKLYKLYLLGVEE